MEKLLELNTDGSIPSDNPFINQEGALPEIYSYGHRNPQGIVVANGLIYENEHGPMGGDELNTLQAKKIMDGQLSLMEKTIAEQ